ncbi:MAG: RelA/SpoT family protein [Bacteroidales bacterium]|nr:RelA/SpoT family protein [Bacteroidales bacterium]
MARNYKNIENIHQAFLKLVKQENSEILKTCLQYVEIQNNNNEELLLELNKSFAVSKICINEINLDRTISIACILNYSLPRTLIKIDEIQEKFGARIANMILGLTKIPDIQLNKLNIQTENFIKLILTISPDITSILIKLAEMLHLLRELKNEEEEKQFPIASVISTLYAPIAHRLGLYAIKTEMEDLSMKYLHAEIYKEIAKKLEKTKDNRNSYIKSFIAPLKKELEKHKINCEIKGRPKSIHSIWNKMRTQGVDFEEVYDKFAIRVIIDSKPENEKTDCWRVYSIITDWYKPNPHRLRDWISSPKSSGYESLHTTVIGPEQRWVEVQIRTFRMDEIAEKGHAAHWKYKEKKEGSGADWLVEMREALEKPTQLTDIEHDKNKALLYTDEIFLFTPDGDLRKLRAGHTVLDFAFSIHSDIGETCTGAIVNDKIVSLKHCLKNGDHIKILTSKTQKPRYEWLEIVKSQRAKSKIKRALKSIDYKDSDIGKDILKHKLSQLKIIFNDVNINNLAEQLGYKSSVDLYQAVGSGKFELNKIKKAFAEISDETDKQKENKKAQTIEISEDTLITSTDFLIIENNLQTIDYQLAKCCNPIPGDDIFGFVTVSKGTKIHKRNCSNAKDMISRYPYRVIGAKWNTKSEMSKFMAHIRITGRDNIGVTNSITEIISKEFKLNLRGITIHPRKDNQFEGVIVTTVNSKKQLDDLINRLRRIEDIMSVTRISK